MTPTQETSPVSITAKAKSAEPDDVVITVEVTMTAGEWKEMLAQVKPLARYPTWVVVRAISEAVNKFTDSHESVMEYSR